MAKPQKSPEQITVSVDPDLRVAIERAAAAEHRTMAGQIRHWIMTALNQAGTTASYLG